MVGVHTHTEITYYLIVIIFFDGLFNSSILVIRVLLFYAQVMYYVFWRQPTLPSSLYNCNKPAFELAISITLMAVVDPL